MLKVLLIVVLIVAFSFAFLSIRLLCGKKRFVHSHIDGNKALNSQGIFCAKRQDGEIRKRCGLRIPEHQ